jgi:mitogen-activated protein kinase 1/3
MMESNLKPTQEPHMFDWSICERNGYFINTTKGFLGSGAYGQVVEAENMLSGQQVAIKRISHLFLNDIDTKRILREISLLQYIKNEFIVELLDILYDETDCNFDTIFLIFEYLPLDLKKILKTAPFLEISVIKFILYQILCGLKFIHSCAVLHRDLKPGNILVDKYYNIKICDFGLARSICNPEEEEQLQQDIMEVDDCNIKSSEINVNNTDSPIIQPQKKHSRLLERGNYKDYNNNNTECIDIENFPKMSVNGKPFLGTMKKSSKQILSKHVATRWYRAPELILMQDYTEAIDVWSVGCIFAELMLMMNSNVKTHAERQPFFPGKHCYPLSPQNGKRQIKLNDKGFPIDKSHQLNVIFDVMGTPKEEDLNYIPDQDTVNYIKSLEYRPKKDLKAIFPGSPDLALDLLDKLLHFNPFKRVTVDDALNHSFFEDIRDVSIEVVNDCNLDFPFEQEEKLELDIVRFYMIEFIKNYKNSINVCYLNK